MKSTDKIEASPAPATPAQPAPALKRKSTRAPKVKNAPAAAPAAPAASPATVITAKIDVGFGNALYVRGEGPGLSWNKGVLLNCLTKDTWTLSIADAAKPLTFKFLINDQTWSRGEDYVAAVGASTEYTPVF